MTLREFCERYRKGDFFSGDWKVQADAGWNDWNCDDRELLPRLTGIWEILKGIENDLVLDGYRARFNNFYVEDEVCFEPAGENHGCNGMFGVVIRHNRSGGKYKVFSNLEEFRIEAKTDDVEEVRRFIVKMAEELWVPRRKGKALKLSQLMDVINDCDAFISIPRHCKKYGLGIEQLKREPWYIAASRKEVTSVKAIGAGYKAEICIEIKEE